MRAEAASLTPRCGLSSLREPSCIRSRKQVLSLTQRTLVACRLPRAAVCRPAALCLRPLWQLHLSENFVRRASTGRRVRNRYESTVGWCRGNDSTMAAVRRLAGRLHCGAIDRRSPKRPPELLVGLLTASAPVPEFLAIPDGGSLDAALADLMTNGTAVNRSAQGE